MKKKERFERRKRRTRAKIFGTAERPRLSVFRSNKAVYAQLIDDDQAKTLVAISERDLAAADKKGSKTDRARTAGKLLGQKALKKKIKTAIFDRGAYRYHGRIKALAEGAREAGLKF